MRIDRPSIEPISQPSDSDAKATVAAKTAVAGDSSAVVVSDNIKTVSAAHSAHAERVARIAASVRDGSYKVNPARIAAKMIDESK